MQSKLTPTTMQPAYAEGRRAGLAIGALAVAAVAFVSLLGIEKAVLAAVLAAIALRGAASDLPARKLAWAALIVAAVYAVTYLIVLVLFREQLAELLRLMQKIG